MGAVVKVVFRFREAPWDAAGLPDLAFLHTPAGPFQAWWMTRPMRTTVLTGWAGGPAAERLAGQDPTAVLARALGALADTLPADRRRLEAELEAWHVFDWLADPFSQGAYSYVPVHELKTPSALAEPVEGTLFFAGEATHDRLSGTVAGALASGYRAADEVLRSLGGEVPGTD